MEGLERYVDLLIPGLPPAAAIVIYFVIKNWTDVKTAIQRLYTDRHADYVDKREANQDIQASQVDFGLQERATKESRAWAVETNSFNLAKSLMTEMLDWAKGDFSKMQDEIAALRQITQDNNTARIEAINALGQRITQLDDRMRILNSIITRIDDTLRQK